MKRHFHQLLPVVSVVFLLASPALAAHPDMTGTWVVDAAKSDFGPMPEASDLAFKIAATGEDFTVIQSGAGQPETTLRFNTSGKEVTNEVPGAKMTSAHHWEGNVLVGDIKLIAQDGSTITFKDRVSFSADGKVMTLSRDISGPAGASQQKLVMNRK
ncbi:MAG TPA: hypothetical protein VEQ10_12650 [Vicinamibacteria bacterium]|nr:hypothetical protein [Vicinamibacteria bacterium]